MSTELELFEEDDVPEVSEAPAPADPIGDALLGAIVTGPGLMEILPADFPLPALIKFVPNPRVKAALDAAVERALKVKVEGGGEGALVAGDAVIAELADAIKACDEEFEDAARAADAVHKSITGTRGKWKAQAVTIRELLGKQMFRERRRLDEIAEDNRRKAQEEENRKARELERQKAEQAKAAGAPAKVVEKIEKQAAVIQAPPLPARTPVRLPSTSVVTRFRGRLKGTPADAEQHPAVTDLTEEQWEKGMRPLLEYILANAPGTFRSAIAIDWAAIDARAKEDGKSFSVPGLEPFEDGGVRSKGRR